jgi:hypothetical protein
MNEMWPWLTLALLGAYHGINPGMGWLFAVALGLQERSRAAVLRAFVPIALGHALSIGLVVALLGMAQAFVAPTTLRNVGAVALIIFGLYKLLAPMSHPRWVGMRVNFRDLTLWSFLMATAHGAGLMLAPILLHLAPYAAPQVVDAAPLAIVQVAPTTAADIGAYCMPSYGSEDMSHADHAAYFNGLSGSGLQLTEVGAVGVHTLAMFVVMAVIAVVVFEKLGVSILRRAWFNLDRMWAIALVGAGVITFLF